MTKLLGIISLILVIVLFPPAALAVISNNAVPGDATYPVKRFLEDGIFTVASLNPVTKAWFAAARSDRRFQEFTTLIAQGKKGGETLDELVEQTQVAASQVAQVKDESQKQKLIQQLSDSIKKYDQGLQQVSSPVPSNPISVVPATPVPQETPNPTPQPRQTSVPVVVQPTSAPTAVPTPIPTSRPTPAPTPSPAPHPSDADRQRQIDEARKQLEEIRKRLAHQASQPAGQPQSREENRGRSNDQGGERNENRRNNNSDSKSERGNNRGR